jgi:hypothetical protein
MDRRTFMNSTAFAATIAALANPLRLIAGPKIVAPPPDFTAAEASRILRSVPCRRMRKFVDVWNGPYPSVEDLRRRIAAERAWLAKRDDGYSEEIEDLEEALAEAEKRRAEEPERYDADQRRRIDIEVTRPGGSWASSKDVAFRMLEWVLVDWFAAWIEHVCTHAPKDPKTEVLLEDLDGWSTHIIRGSDVRRHADVLDMVAPVLAMRESLRDHAEHQAIPEISEAAYETMERTGWHAAVEGAEDCVIDNTIDALLSIAWDVVEETVAASGVTEFDALATSLRASAIGLLEELNAEGVEDAHVR